MRPLRFWRFGGILLAACLLRCGQDKNVAEKTVREWIGREIVFPDCSHMGMDRVCVHLVAMFPAPCRYTPIRPAALLAMGNPTLNPKLWDLYKVIVTGEDERTEVEKSNARAP